MGKVTIKQLLEAGVHFGHQTRRWNPKMARYIFGDRNGIYIIDLEKTLVCLEEACAFVEGVVKAGKDVLFVGTKKQAQTILEENAKKVNMPFVVNRWLGGMLTNFQTVSKSITRMKQITAMEESGAFETLTKKEISMLRKEKDKMQKNLDGIKDVSQLPGAVIIVDTKKEQIALQEARKLRIPIIALLDTNCDPDEVEYPIPGNDDALRSISTVCDALTDAIAEGVQERERIKKAEAAEKEAAAAAKSE